MANQRRTANLTILGRGLTGLAMLALLAPGAVRAQKTATAKLPMLTIGAQPAQGAAQPSAMPPAAVQQSE